MWVGSFRCECFYVGQCVLREWAVEEGGLYGYFGEQGLSVGVHPAVKGTRWNRIGLGLKFIYDNSHTIKYIIDQSGNCTISYQTYIIAVSLDRRVLPCRCASVRVRETT